jgi:transposase-like protein
VGIGAVEIRPRVSDVPEGEPFRSEVVGRWERRSRTQGRLLARLYLEGLATGDFRPVFRALVGETAGLSPNTIQPLKGEWEDEYRLWRCRPLTERYVYVFADSQVIVGGRRRRSWKVRGVLGLPTLRL